MTDGTRPTLTLRRWRLRQALTQEAIAAKFGTEQRQWQRWEKHYSKPGSRRPPERIVRALYEASDGRVNVNSWSCEVMDACAATRVGDLRENGGRVPRPSTQV